MDELKSIQNSNQVTQAQLAENTQRIDEDASAKLAEMDIVLADLEQANLNVVRLEAELVSEMMIGLLSGIIKVLILLYIFSI